MTAFLAITSKVAMKLCVGFCVNISLCFPVSVSSLTLYSDILLDLDSPAPVTTPAPAPVSASNDLWGDFSTASRY